MNRIGNKFGPAYIESGVLVNVDVDRFTVDVACSFSQRRYLSIPAMSPYLHPYAGEGVYVMPEVGAPCWVCQPSEKGARPFLLGYGGMWDSDHTYRSFRPAMNHGDILFATRDRNMVFLRRGGVVQVQSTPLSQRMYMPLGNLIRDICEAYHLRSFAGEMSWEVDRTDETTTGDRPTRMRAFVRDLADAKHPIAELVMGDHDQGDKKFTLIVYDKGDDGRAVQVSCSIEKTGNVTWDIEGDWSASVKGDWAVTAETGDVKLKADAGAGVIEVSKTLTLRSGDTTKVLAPTFQVGEAGVGLEVVTGASPSVKLAGGGSSLVKGDALLRVLTPVLTALASLTPTVPSTSAVALASSTALSGLSDVLSSKATTG